MNFRRILVAASCAVALTAATPQPDMLPTQVLLDRENDNLWCIEAAVDLSGERDPVGPLLRVQRIGT